MKGVIFIVLRKLVEEKFDLETWDNILNSISAPSNGIYTSIETYEDSELFSIVGQLSKISDIPVNDLIKAFGTYLLLELSSKYKVFFENNTPKEFLLSIDEVIHVEVKKLFPEAKTPKITYEDLGPQKLILIYSSPRNLCLLAEGLIEGVEKYYGEKISS